jgi:hypothetical protein
VPPSAEPAAAGPLEDLAARQRALVAALVTGTAAPAGVAPDRVRAQALALVGKRARTVARREPEVAARLGEEFWPAFQRYAAAQRHPPEDSAADARAFRRYARAARIRHRLRGR